MGFAAKNPFGLSGLAHGSAQPSRTGPVWATMGKMDRGSFDMTMGCLWAKPVRESTGLALASTSPIVPIVAQVNPASEKKEGKAKFCLF